MKLNTELGSEQGSALVDLIGFGILLQVPILMFATLAIQSQQQSFAAEAIARHGLRAHVLWPDRTNTERVIEELAQDFGIAMDRIEWRLGCVPNPNCLASGSTAQIEVRIGAISAYSSQRF